MPIFPIIIMIEFIWKNGFIKKRGRKNYGNTFLMEVKEDIMAKFAITYENETIK